MGFDAPLRFQLGPEVLRKGEVGRAVAVQVTYLPAADLEGMLAALARARLYSGPGGQLRGDLLAWRW
jgi:hypothetical protein